MDGLHCSVRRWWWWLPDLRGPEPDQCRSSRSRCTHFKVEINEFSPDLTEACAFHFFHHGAPHSLIGSQTVTSTFPPSPHADRNAHARVEPLPCANRFSSFQDLIRSNWTACFDRFVLDSPYQSLKGRRHVPKEACPAVRCSLWDERYLFRTKVGKA